MEKNTNTLKKLLSGAKTVLVYAFGFACIVVGIITIGSRPLIGAVGFVALMMFGGWYKWKVRRAEMDYLSDELAQIEDAKFAKAVHDGAIYLIKSYALKADMVYKVVVRDDTLYFCYAGGKDYIIDSDIAANTALTEEELLSHEKSFLLPLDEISRVTVNSRPRPLSGNFPNNGVAVLHVVSNKLDFVTHPINDYAMLEEFFSAVGLPVTVVIDKVTIAAQAEEKQVQEFAEHSPERLDRLRRICRALGIAGWAFAVLAFIFPWLMAMLVVVGLLLPVAAFCVYLANKDIVTLSAISEQKDAKPPCVASAVCAPAFGLAIIPILEYNIFYDAYLWVVVLFTTAALAAVVFVLSPECRQRKLLRFVMPIIAGIFAFGAMLTTNVEFDPAPHPSPERHVFTQFERGRVSTSRNAPDRYILTLNAPDYDVTPDSFDVSVSRRVFDLAEDGDIVRLCVHPGLWCMQWVGCVTVMTTLR